MKFATNLGLIFCRSYIVVSDFIFWQVQNGQQKYIFIYRRVWQVKVIWTLNNQNRLLKSVLEHITSTLVKNCRISSSWSLPFLMLVKNASTSYCLWCVKCPGTPPLLNFLTRQVGKNPVKRIQQWELTDRTITRNSISTDLLSCDFVLPLERKLTA